MPDPEINQGPTFRGRTPNVPLATVNRFPPRHQPDTPVRKEKSTLKTTTKKTRKAKPKEPPPPKDDAPVDLEE